jgi:Fe2+ transport system protein FeoA
MKATVHLDDLPLGRTGRVAGIDLSPAEGQRLMEMGLTVNTEVKALGWAPLCSPLVIPARGSQLSLRKPVARAIRVVPTEDGRP